MQYKYREPYKKDPDSGCEIIVGLSSWSKNEQSVKFAWKNSLGHVSRGGEVPIEALPQMLEVAIRECGLKA
jgi:hypothetical protein